MEFDREVTYTFMNKNNPLFDVRIEDGFTYYVGNVVSENKHLLPIALNKSKADESQLLYDFKRWWEGIRRIPKSRYCAQTFYQNVDQINFSSIEELIEQSLGLSLSDQYWIKPIDSDISWEDVNYFGNEFSEDVGCLIMVGDYYADFKKLDLKSPDLTCEGVIQKQWIIINGERYLVKGGYKQYSREYLGYLTIKQLFIGQPTQDYVEYSIFYKDEDEGFLRKFDRVYSKCKNFVTEDTEYVPFYQFGLGDAINSKDGIKYDYVKSLYGDKSYVLDLQIILDYITLNRDRHLGNFGLIRDFNTGEFIGPAPIFDNGSSMFFDIYDEGAELNVEEIEKKKVKPFNRNFDEMLGFVDLSRYREGIYELQRNAEKIFDEAMSETLETHKRVLHLKQIYIDRIDRVVKLLKEVE